MSLNGKMPEVFDTDVVSVFDFMKRIAKIKEFCNKNEHLKWNFFTAVIGIVQEPKVIFLEMGILMMKRKTLRIG